MPRPVITSPHKNRVTPPRLRTGCSSGGSRIPWLVHHANCFGAQVQRSRLRGVILRMGNRRDSSSNLSGHFAHARRDRKNSALSQIGFGNLRGKRLRGREEHFVRNAPRTADEQSKAHAGNTNELFPWPGACTRRRTAPDQTAAAREHGAAVRPCVSLPGRAFRFRRRV